MANKLYNSKAWLHKRLLVDKRSPEEIAEECGVTKMTIHRKLREFGLSRKK